jgi:hypothetical protein
MNWELGQSATIFTVQYLTCPFQQGWELVKGGVLDEWLETLS